MDGHRSGIMRLTLFLTIFSLSQSWAWDSEADTLNVVDLSQANPDSRIIGGTSTTIERFPYAVQVQRSNQLTCGGTLLTNRAVLSAAHCFVDRFTPRPDPSQYTIRAGTALRGSGGTTSRVSVIVVHQSYNTVTHDADVALMVLASRLSFSTKINRASLPMQGQSLPVNTGLIHVGWGTTIAGINALPTTLQEVTVRKVNWTTCAERYRYLQAITGEPFLVTTNMICAGLLDVGGADACQGDSGGPLLYGNIVVGITSWGYSCGHPSYPGVSARVASFTNWINTTVNQYSSSPGLSGSTTATSLLLVTSLLASFTLMIKDF